MICPTSKKEFICSLNGHVKDQHRCFNFSHWHRTVANSKRLGEGGPLVVVEYHILIQSVYDDWKDREGVEKRKI